jgi:hypothetical protein
MLSLLTPNGAGPIPAPNGLQAFASVFVLMMKKRPFNAIRFIARSLMAKCWEKRHKYLICLYNCAISCKGKQAGPEIGSAAGDPRFAAKVLAVKLHCPDAYAQQGRDLLVGLTAANQIGNLHLAMG